MEKWRINTWKLMPISSSQKELGLDVQVTKKVTSIRFCHKLTQFVDKIKDNKKAIQKQC